jgi:L-2,4-diaminobutyrate decarboxylase
VLTDGGSLANLSALLSARAAAVPEAWERGVGGGLVLLASPASHYSIARAAGIMGLGAAAVRPLEVDAREVVRPDRIPAAIARQHAAGNRIVALVASACATGTGLYDPLTEIAAACQEAGVWLHVDGAHGAAALLSPRERHHLEGVAGASSLVWDAHKMLRTSGLCAAVLVRDGATLEAAFRQEASYIFYGNAGDGVDLITRTVECTKAPLGLKVLLNLLVRGEDGLRRHVEDRFAMARRLHARIEARPGFEAPFPPAANIVCFRYQGSDELQIRLREGLLRSGRHHISSTAVAGRRYLRLALMGPGTDESILAALLDDIEALAAADGAGPSGSA